VGRLRIELEARGLETRVAVDGLSAVFVDERGELRLRYRGLRAWDATGRELDVRLHSTPAGLAVSLDDAEARYPIVVDPVFSGADWIVEGDQESAWFGLGVGGAGDVNGDGYDDVIVGARVFFGASGLENAFLYLGSAGGPSATPDWSSSASRSCTVISVSGAGDVNGDGYDDVIVGEPCSDSGGSGGRAALYLGSASGLSDTPSWVVRSEQFSASYGTSVSGAGDVNADGYDDVIIGASRFDGVLEDEGRAFLYLGSAGGLSPDPDWTAEGGQEDAQFGTSVSGAGDVNGDGYGDVIVGARFFDDPEWNEGGAFLYFGGAGGLSDDPDWTAESDVAGAWFGASVSGADDVDGDGYADVIVGAPMLSAGETDEGRAYLYLGSAVGLSTDPDWTLESDVADACLGASVSGAGDVDGDGYDDWIVGADSFDGGMVGEGRGYLYLGAASGPSAAPFWTAEIDQAGAGFGQSASGAGDVDGDGLDDFLFGAPRFHDGEPYEGAAFLYLGRHFVDCNDNGVDDADDIASGTSEDCNSNGIPDECEKDCNSNGIPDDCDIASGTSPDCNANGLPDECDLALGTSQDCNSNGVPDECDLASGTSDDCNCNSIPDECDSDADGDGIPDDCGSIGTAYCPCTPSSAGPGGVIAATGSASSAAGDLLVEAYPVPNQPGIFFHGPNAIEVPFGNGNLCVGGGLKRGVPVVATGNRARYLYDNSDRQRDLSAHVGTNRKFQYWFRDPSAGGPSFNLSTAVAIDILP